jgi:SAM-dependent methyltransferase
MPTGWIVNKLRGAARRLLMACGIDFYHESEDRRVLESVILPHLAGRADVRDVLFVGCAWYTRGYRKLFETRNYSTLEIDPRAAKYGARRHIVDSLENIRLHFKEGELDAIICNGVFGWGLDEKSVVEKAFDGCFECLRPGGIFVLGWNDVVEHKPFPPQECRSLQRFAPYLFPPLAGCEFLTATYNRHTYLFYRKEGLPS